MGSPAGCIWFTAARLGGTSDAGAIERLAGLLANLELDEPGFSHRRETVYVAAQYNVIQYFDVH